MELGEILHFSEARSAEAQADRRLPFASTLDGFVGQAQQEEAAAKQLVEERSRMIADVARKVHVSLDRGGKSGTAESSPAGTELHWGGGAGRAGIDIGVRVCHRLLEAAKLLAEASVAKERPRVSGRLGLCNPNDLTI